MPTFQRCDNSVNEMAAEILTKFETHKPILDARVKIDFVFAFPDCSQDTGEPMNDALRKGGVKCLGICRKIPLKDRALGRGDAEISLDGDWWKQASEGERRSLLDHELHHLDVKKDGKRFELDDLGRPVLRMRSHDVEIGWFRVVAERNGADSQERIQAKSIMENDGQFFWPELAK